MKADYLSYQHATNRSLLGLAIQVVLGLILLVYSFYSQDHAAMTAAFFVLIGSPVWLALAVVFDQHRRERIEAVEAEAFAARDAAGSSVFETQAEDLRVAHKRLRWLYRFFIPGMSLAIAALLILVGLWRFRSATIAPAGGKSVWEGFTASPHRGWAIAIGLGVAFVGFLFARYMSGMAKQKVWENLRAGAAYAAGTALLGLCVAIGHFIDIPGPDIVLRVLVVAFPVLMIAIGCEIVLWFLLELYRPRKVGEFPRPAFESRALGFLAAPDKIAESIGEAINYQFGYDVTDSWVYRLLARSVFRVLVPVVVLVLWGLTCLTVIRPHERGLVLRWGELSRTIEPGLHIKLPWPIERVEVPAYVTKNAQGVVHYGRPTATGVRVLDIGTAPPDPTKTILWTNEHAQEVFFLVQPGDLRETAPAAPPPEGAPAEGQAEGRVDLAMLAVEIPIHYVIDDVEDYERLAPPEMRDDLLKAVAQRAVMQRLSSMTVGDLLSGRRTEVGGELRKAVEADFAKLNRRTPGKPVVKVLFIGVDGVHPPQQQTTARLFEQVVEAEQKLTAKTLKAQADRIRTLTEAVGSVELARVVDAEIDRLDALRQGGADPAEVSKQQIKVANLIKAAGGRAAVEIQTASADRWVKHMGEKALLTQYQGELGTYRASPAVYRAGLYFDALRSSLVNSRVFITDGKSPLNVRFDLQDKDTSSQILGTQNPINQ